MTGYPLEVQRKLIEGGMARGIKVDTSLVYCHYSLNDTTLVDGQVEGSTAAANANTFPPKRRRHYSPKRRSIL